MSNTVQHKLLGMEVPPPPGVWDRIAADLNDADLDKQYPSSLYEMTVAPPATTWEKITSQLDETAASPTLTEKLLQYEVTPPAAAWAGIAAALDAEKEAPLPEKRKTFPLLRYAAAAAIISFLTWGGYVLLNQKKQNGTVAKTNPANTPPQNDTPGPDEEHTTTASQDKLSSISESAIAGADEARNDAALEASKKTFARLESSVVNSKIKEAANFYFGAASGTTRGLDIGDGNDVPTYTKEADRYVVLMTPDGNIIRMSRKLGDMICCVSGEEQDEDCKYQLKKWQEKMANSATGHSPGNFMDILSLLSTLQDEKDQY